MKLPRRKTATPRFQFGGPGAPEIHRPFADKLTFSASGVKTLNRIPRLPPAIVKLVQERDQLIQDIARYRKRPNPYGKDRAKIQKQRTALRHEAEARLHEVEQTMCGYLAAVVHRGRK